MKRNNSRILSIKHFFCLFFWLGEFGKFGLKALKIATRYRLPKKWRNWKPKPKPKRLIDLIDEPTPKKEPKPKKLQDLLDD